MSIRNFIYLSEINAKTGYTTETTNLFLYYYVTTSVCNNVERHIEFSVLVDGLN